MQPQHNDPDGPMGESEDHVASEFAADRPVAKSDRFARFSMKKPCGNCPFRKVGAIDLSPGRLAGICNDLMANDRVPFVCHKTLSGSHEEDHDDGSEASDDGAGSYSLGERDSFCAGSMVFLLKAKSPNVSMRMGAALGLLSYDELRAQFGEIIEPSDVLSEKLPAFHRPGRNT